MSKAKGTNPTVLQMNIIDMWVRDISDKSIAEALNCSYETVRSVKNCDTFKKIFYERQRAQIVELLPLAVRRLKDILKDDSQIGTVTIAAIREVLDRSRLSELLDDGNKDIKITVTYE